MADTNHTEASIEEQINVLRRAIDAAWDALPEAIANHLVCDYEEWYRLCQIDHPAPLPIIASARAVLALPVPVPAPAVDREGLIDFLVDLYLTRLDVDSAPQGWPRLTAEALISAGLVRGAGTAKEAHRA